MSWLAFAGCDPAYVKDAFAGCVVQRRGDEFRVAGIFERKPSRGKPLVPSTTTREFGEWAARLGAKAVMSDGHYAEQIKVDLSGLLQFEVEPSGSLGKASVYETARELIHGGRIRWSEGHKTLVRQLREVFSRPLPGGLVSIQSPRRSGSHGDVASAFCRAVFLASRGTGLTEAERRAFRDANQRLRNSPKMARWPGGGRGF